MSIRPLILHTCSEWTALSALRSGAPHKEPERSAIYRTGQRFGAVHLIDVLRGRATERISKWEHDKLSVFGIGTDLDEPTWRGIFRQFVAPATCARARTTRPTAA